MNFIGLPLLFAAAGDVTPQPTTLNNFFLMIVALATLASAVFSFLNKARMDKVDKGQQQIHFLINSRFDEWKKESEKAAQARADSARAEGEKVGMAAGVAQEVARAQGLAVGVLIPVPGPTANTPDGLAAGAKGLAAGAEGLAAGAQGLKAGAEGLAAGAKRSGEPKP